MRLTWDGIGTRFFKAGLDRGVIYPLLDSGYGPGIAWNGLTAVEDNTGGHDKTALFTNDYRRGFVFTPYEFGGTIKCYTYPSVFEQCIGNEEILKGFYLKGSDAIPFGLSYRTMLGNDTEGLNAGYEIHILYASYVTEAKEGADTIGSEGKATELNFSFESTYEDFTDRNPASHIVLNSRIINPEKLALVEDVLYGNDEGYPRLPLPDELYDLIFDPNDVPDDYHHYPYNYWYPDNNQYPPTID